MCSSDLGMLLSRLVQDDTEVGFLFFGSYLVLRGWFLVLICLLSPRESRVCAIILLSCLLTLVSHNESASLLVN